MRGYAIVKGAVKGRYVLYDVIAAGGMGSVHFARLVGAAGFSRVVAVKRVRKERADSAELLAMLADEARIASRIRHPNVVSTLDFFEDGDELFLVMDYVPGESLARLLSRSQTSGRHAPPSVVVAVVSNILRGLHAAHEARDDRGAPLGIVHRDVSPQNVLVGADGITRLLDFGIAKAEGRRAETLDGTVKGKVAYMAPEQLRGESVGPRTDLYAASIVLWESLTLRRLAQGAEIADVIAETLARNGTVPSEVGLPEALSRVVRRGLARDPKERFATALEMATAVEEAVAPAPPTEVAAWTESLAGDALQRRASSVADFERAPLPKYAAPEPTGSSENALQPSPAPSPALPRDASRERHSRVLRYSLLAGLAVLVIGLAAFVWVRPSSRPPFGLVAASGECMSHSQARVRLLPCSGDRAQAFHFEGHHIVGAGGFCVSTAKDATTAGTATEMRRCSDTARGQSWVWGGTTLQGPNGLCLGVVSLGSKDPYVGLVSCDEPSAHWRDLTQLAP